MRSRQHLSIGVIIFLALCYFGITRLSGTADSIPYHPPSSGESQSHSTPPPPPSPNQDDSSSSSPEAEEEPVEDRPTYMKEDTKPLPIPPDQTHQHPIAHLIAKAEKDLSALVERQSKTLLEAVAEYKRRYKIPPPPGFDKWFAFAQSRNVVLVDEFDSIHDMLLPFWGLRPSTVRRRAREALGNPDNYLLGVVIRNGTVAYTAGGDGWMRQAVRGMMEKFVGELGDMEVVINVHDEPRVVVEHGDLERLVDRGRRAQEALMKKGGDGKEGWRGEWSQSKWDGMPVTGFEFGGEVDEMERVMGWRSRFNVFAHQQTWFSTRVSCPPDSPARALEDELDLEDGEEGGEGHGGHGGQDLKSHWALSDAEFIHNTTAHTDICIHPAASHKHALFQSPNAFNIAHSLIPIFSQSKLSNFQDLLFPSPWYWNDNVPYKEWDDPVWEEKDSRMFWRGSTTGGFAKGAKGWEDHHRQRFVKGINDREGEAVIFTSTTSDDDTEPHSKAIWKPEVQPKSEALPQNLTTISFTTISQCDAPACASMRQHFPLSHYTTHTSFTHKHLLDMDGNAFSGRFYSFLRSRSLVYKYGMFREWHDEWIRPWVHYIPLSLDGRDWVEVVRTMVGTGWGDRVAKRVAGGKKEWAEGTVRRVDMEVWFWRVLIEYARVVDEGRGGLGFDVRVEEEGGEGAEGAEAGEGK